MLLGIGAITAGLWAIFNYRRNKRDDAARWLEGVFRDFYLSDMFTEVRHLLKYSYPERAEPLPAADRPTDTSRSD